ncbi:MAG: hypothetical protein B7Z55_09540 [Planctomycetales bacterium 12-60-4]|nr:MAG: hypothetical protein B7Z55_09540 [Planctomycetales bacterium 12-60-4]
MTAENKDFLTQLPVMLRLLANPTTPHTALELCCRIRSFGWEECEPTLMAELETGSASVKQLVLGVIREESDQFGDESVRSFVLQVVSLLKDEDRLVRMSAIHAVESLRVSDDNVVAALRHIVANDEPILASQALTTLLELDLDHTVIQEIAVRFRERSE